MKKLVFLLCMAPALVRAQPGYITTIAGNGSSGFSGDGGPATAASMRDAAGNVCFDGIGNVYINDYLNGRVRKVNSAGIITTIAGGGGSTADGIPATAAGLSLGLFQCDLLGNLYLIDGFRIRKVSATTGIITTVAGSTAGFSGDGGPATAAQFDYPHGLCFDFAGNLYVGDENNARVRKITPSGIITTFAGNGTSSYGGDGGPATAAQLVSPAGLCADAMGNLYIADRYGYRIRKVNASGIISTYAGHGSGGYGGDGGAATAASFNLASDVGIDAMGNLYVSDCYNQCVRKITPSGIISTFAGRGSSLSEGIPATSASLTDEWGIGVDVYNNVYVTDRYNCRVRKVNSSVVPTAVGDSFSVFVTTLCAGPSIMVAPNHYSSGLSIQTWFGDGTSQTDTFSSYSGYAIFSHTYLATGTYTLKFILFNGGTPVDTILHSYAYAKCTTIPITIFYDNNGNCSRDTGEIGFSKAMEIAVDSNGLTIDTISCLSGVYYNAFGVTGDIYTFRPISATAGLSVTCPATGVVTDTISASVYGCPPLYFGFTCDTIHAFDLGIHFSVAGTGRHAQDGNIYAFNSYCPPTNGVATLYHSPKYAYHSAIPTPTSITATSISWNLSGLSNIDALTHLYYMLEVPSTYLTPGDTTNSTVIIAPGTGDADTSNNVIVRNDTVLGSYDPNFIESTPSGHILAGSTLRYTVGFENDGNDTAHNIYVLDTLSDYLEASTLKPVFASNEMYIEKLATTSGSTVYKFDFPNIKLLDSSHLGLCKGTFQYDIKVKNGLPDCTYIPARVGIYFDDNPVVMTNTHTNVIGCWPSVVGSLQSAVCSPLVYPNPASDVLNIETSAGAFQNYSVTNNMGSVVMNGSADGAHTKLNIKNLPAGIYCIRLMGEQGVEVRKFLKE